MTTRVTITNPARSEDGLSALARGTEVTVSDEYALYLIRAFDAIDTDGAKPLAAAPSSVRPEDVPAIQSLVSDDGIASPITSMTAATGAAGVLSGAYSYSFLFRTALGDTAPWPGTLAAVNPSSQRVNLSNIPVGPVGVIARVLVRTVAAPADVKDYRILAVIPDNTTTTYTDNIPDGSLGAPVSWNATNRGRFRTATGDQFAEFSDQSTGFGQGAFAANVGYASSAFGYRSLASITTGRRNTAIGVYALENVTEGRQNTALGVHAGNGITTGASNTCLGYATGGTSGIGVGNFNTLVGDAAGGSNSITGNGNVAVGYRSLALASGTVSYNTVLGTFAGKYSDTNFELWIDCALDRGSKAAQKESGLIWGRGETSVPANQRLQLNSITRLGSSNAATVASLPAAAGLAGHRGYVTDASVAYTGANIGSTVVGGGANTVPVFCNGTQWVIG